MPPTFGGKSFVTSRCLTPASRRSGRLGSRCCRRELGLDVRVVVGRDRREQVVAAEVRRRPGGMDPQHRVGRREVASDGLHHLRVVAAADVPEGHERVAPQPPAARGWRGTNVRGGRGASRRRPPAGRAGRRGGHLSRRPSARTRPRRRRRRPPSVQLPPRQATAGPGDGWAGRPLDTRRTRRSGRPAPRGTRPGRCRDAAPATPGSAPRRSHRRRRSRPWDSRRGSVDTRRSRRPGAERRPPAARP